MYVTHPRNDGAYLEIGLQMGFQTNMSDLHGPWDIMVYILKIMGDISTYGIKHDFTIYIII